jgi:AraC-like DNA-binding protein
MGAMTPPATADLLAPLRTLAVGGFQQHCLPRSTVRYFSPFSGVFVTIADWSREDESWLHGEGKHMLSLAFPLHGDCVLLAAQQSECLYSASKVTAVYRPMNCPFRIFRPKKTDVLSVGLHFSQEAFNHQALHEALGPICSELPKLFGTTQRFLGTFPIGNDLYWSLLAFAEKCRSVQPPSMLRIAIDVLEIIEQLTEMPPRRTLEPLRMDRPLSEREKLLLGRTLMDANFSKVLTVKALAGQVGMSKTKFNDAFREAFGVPPMTYLTEFRMNEAKKLLTIGKARVSQIAWSVGYTHPCNFAVAFKRHCGLSPSDFRWTASGLSRRQS